jgi:hypothetical protein
MNCDYQMLALTRFFSKDIFDFSNTGGFLIFINLTESKLRNGYLIIHPAFLILNK